MVHCEKKQEIMVKKMQHPYFPKKRSPLWAVAHPVSVGVITSAVSASLSNVKVNTLTSSLLEQLPGGNHVSPRIPLALVGFLFGFGGVKVWHRLRMRLIKSLLSYFGWMTSPKSAKTKVKPYYITV